MIRIDWIMMNHVISCVVIINEPRWAHSLCHDELLAVASEALLHALSVPPTSSDVPPGRAHTDRFSLSNWQSSPCLATSATSLNLMALGFQLCLRCQNLGNVNLCKFLSSVISAISCPKHTNDTIWSAHISWCKFMWENAGAASMCLLLL